MKTKKVNNEYTPILKSGISIQKIENVEQLFNQVELLGGCIYVSLNNKKFYRIERLK